MCGICGFYAAEDRELLRRMNASIEHRGPDDEGYFSDDTCSLAMRRLAIIDVQLGKQPMHNENEDIWIVFNGEIYNYKSLRDELSNHRFYTNSDTEAIVHAYEEFGDDCASQLNGMFAFAIWDSRRKRLFLARDRFGEKPLYYTFAGKSMFFASEIKAILQNREIRRGLNPAALHDYLSFRCNSTNETFFRGIFKLPPAHCLVYDGKKPVLRQYWSPKVQPDYSGTEEQFADELYSRLSESVKMRMMSEVPLGAYLSGGIDSGSVVGLMSQHSQEPVKTFSVGFEDNFDELNEARFLANHFRTDHREIMVKPDAIDLLPKIVWHLDEPMADPTCIPVYLLSREVKPYATVVLTGDGSDELLYGYEQFRFMAMHRRFLTGMPSPLRKSIHLASRLIPMSLLDVIFRYSSSLGAKGMERFREFISTDDPARMYLSLVSIFSEDEKRKLFNPDLRARLSSIRLAADINRDYFSSGSSFISNVVRLDVDRILAENMLMRSDKNTMAFSVEQRVPFLDHTLAEFIYSIPPELKLSGSTDKYILRRAMQKLVPSQTAKRKKSRFFVPIHRWMEGELGEIARQSLRDSKLFRKAYADNIFKDMKRSRLYYSRQLWALLIFNVWHRMFIEDKLSARPAISLRELL